MSAPNTIPSFSADTSLSSGQHRNDNSNPQQGTGGLRPIDSSDDSRLSDVATTIPMPYTRPTIKIPPTKKDERKLFVGGLPSNVTNEEFRSFFEQFGPVLDSIVLVDRNTNRSRGFGFVTFQNAETSRKLLAMGQSEESNHADPKVGRLEMLGKIVEVKSAEPKESTRRPTSRHTHGMSSATHMPHPVPTAVNHSAFPVTPPEGGTAYAHPFYVAPGVVFAGHAAPMYYRLPPAPEGQPMLDFGPVQPQPYAMEGYVPAFSFVPSPPYGLPNAPPQFPIQHPHYLGGNIYEGVDENNSST